MALEKYLYGEDVPDDIRQAIKKELDKLACTEEELREGEELFQSLAAGSIQGILIHRNFKPLFVNNAYGEAFGYKPEEILQMESVLPLAAPYERERLIQYKNSRLKGEYAPARYEYQGVRRDGSFVWLDCRESEVGWGQESAILTIIYETAQRRREAELQKSEERFRALSGAAFEGIAIHDRGKILEINQTLADMFGCEPSEIVGKKISELFAPEFRESLYEYILSGTEEHNETVGLKRDGSTFSAEVCSRAIDYQGRTFRALAVRDITERKQAEEEISRRQRETALLAEASSIFNSSLDVKKIFASMAEMVSSEIGDACAVWRLKGEHLQPITVYKRGKEDEKTLKLLTDKPPRLSDTVTGFCVRNREPVLVEEVKNDKRFSDFYRQLVDVHSYICVPLMSRGEVLGALSTAILGEGRKFGSNDLRFAIALADRAAAALENSDLHQQLIQAEKLSAIGELVAGVAHELNNPLSVILGHAQMMLWESGEDNKQAYEAIIKSVERCREITSNLLSFAKEVETKKKAVAINGCIRQTLDIVSNRLGADNIQVELDLDESLPEIMADEEQMEQVFLRVMDNAHLAVKEGGKPGVIHISSKRDGSDMVIVVADNGVGMDEDTVNRAFDPFFTTREVGGGRGLGLSVALGIVKNHNGEMRIKSRPGEGTEVMIRIPIIEAC